MRNIINYSILMVLCIILLIVVSGCYINNSNKEDVREYYNMEDFNDIIIGESTFKDVYNKYPNSIMAVVSYGGYCDYPKKDGDIIRIKFYGSELVVGDISERCQD